MEGPTRILISLFVLKIFSIIILGQGQNLQALFTTISLGQRLRLNIAEDHWVSTKFNFNITIVRYVNSLCIHSFNFFAILLTGPWIHSPSSKICLSVRMYFSPSSSSFRLSFILSYFLFFFTLCSRLETPHFNRCHKYVFPVCEYFFHTHLCSFNQVLIVITDGLQTGRNIKLIREAAQDLRRQGVRIIAVSVGKCKRKTCKVCDRNVISFP